LLVGVLLPIFCVLGEVLTQLVLRRCFHQFYYRPKAVFIQEQRTAAAAALVGLEGMGAERATRDPPLVGDCENGFGSIVAASAVITENVKLLSTFVEIVKTPTSRVWLVTLAITIPLTVWRRSGAFNRLLVRAGLGELAALDALQLSYLRACTGFGYFGLVLIIFLGGTRAVMLGDPWLVIWVGVNSSRYSVLIVLLCQLTAGIVQDFALFVLRKLKLVHYPMCRLNDGTGASNNPLGSREKRLLDAKGYVFATGLGGVFVLGCLLGALDPLSVVGLRTELRVHNMPIPLANSTNESATVAPELVDTRWWSQV
jgi:hypothetical protein